MRSPQSESFIHEAGGFIRRVYRRSIAVTQMLLRAGVAGGLDEHRIRTIIAVNALSLITAGIAIIGPLIIYLFIAPHRWIILPGLSEAVAFCGLIYLNHRRWYKTAATGFYVLQNTSVLFFGLILGRTAEVQQMVVFLIALSCLLYSGRFMSLVCTFISVSLALLLEFNYQYKLVVPMYSSDQAEAVRHVLWPVIVILSVSLVLIWNYNNGASYRRENQLRSRLQAKKEELEKLNASKSIYVRETGHEIRNPLGSIYGISQLLAQLQPGENPGLYKMLVENLQTASIQAMQVINNVLSLSKIESGKTDHLKPGDIDFSKWLHNHVAIHQYRANLYHIRLKVHIDERMPEKIISDIDKLNQILNNLLINAIKFNTQHTDIHIRVMVPQPDKWQLQVADSGTGMTKEVMERIFEPYFSQGDNGDSTGLGLPITRRLVSLLDGDIRVDSRPELGTTFTLTFPLLEAAGQVCPAQHTDLLEQENRFSGLSFLVIEDNKVSAKLLTLYLSRLSGRVFMADNGVDGLRIAKSELPDVILLDTILPRMSGEAVLQHLKADKILQHIPVIITTGNAFDEDKNKLLEAGANHYIIKPFAFADLKQILEECVPAPVGELAGREAVEREAIS